ncbi:MAG: F0F1 ATP synthase subunit B' [Alphaproteobacteria bacterium]|nr:F0F1 ATP synthase subunit B' [Alphaproteobacteria bacterium]
MPQMNADDWPTQIAWLIVTFAILLILMWGFALPRVRRVLDKRRAKIADDVGKAEAFKAEAEAALKAYQAALSDARAKAQGMLAELQARLDKDAAAQRARLDAELSAKAAEAETRIRKARADAMASLREVAAEAAREATRRLIGVEPDRSAVDAAVKSAFESKV